MNFHVWWIGYFMRSSFDSARCSNDDCYSQTEHRPTQPNVMLSNERKLHYGFDVCYEFRGFLLLRNFLWFSFCLFVAANKIHLVHFPCMLQAHHRTINMCCDKSYSHNKPICFSGCTMDSFFRSMAACVLVCSLTLNKWLYILSSGRWMILFCCRCEYTMLLGIHIRGWRAIFLWFSLLILKCVCLCLNDAHCWLRADCTQARSYCKQGGRNWKQTTAWYAHARGCFDWCLQLDCFTSVDICSAYGFLLTC